MRRFHRVTVLLLAVLLGQLTLIGSSFTCTSSASAGAAMAGMAGMEDMAAMPDMGAPPSNATHPDGSSAPSSDSCNLPWAPSGCTLMIPCAPHAMTAPNAVRSAQAAPSRAALMWEQDTPPSPIFTPDPPPPRV